MRSSTLKCLVLLIVTLLALATMASAEPAKPLASATAPPNVTSAAQSMVYDTINLRYTTAAEIKLMLGERAKPKGLKPPAQADATAQPFNYLLPEGIALLSPSAPFSRQLIVAGTPDAIARLRELVAIFDVETKEVSFLVSLYDTTPTAAPDGGWEAIFNQKEPIMKVKYGDFRDFKFGLYVKTTPQFSSAPLLQQTLSIRNNMPTRLVLSAGPDFPQNLLSLIPRINADQSVTLNASLGKLNGKLKPKAAITRAETKPYVSTNVSLCPGQALAFALSTNSKEYILIIQPAN